MDCAVTSVLSAFNHLERGRKAKNIAQRVLNLNLETIEKAVKHKESRVTGTHGTNGQQARLKGTIFNYCT